MRFNTEICGIKVTVQFDAYKPTHWELVAVGKHTSKFFIETVYKHMGIGEEYRVSQECINLKDEAIYQSL